MAREATGLVSPGQSEANDAAEKRTREANELWEREQREAALKAIVEARQMAAKVWGRRYLRDREPARSRSALAPDGRRSGDGREAISPSARDSRASLYSRASGNDLDM